MNPNVNSHFAGVPIINHPRATYDMSCNVKTSFNVGQLIPFFFTEVLPGDTWKVNTSKVLRMTPMVTAPMDNLYMDFYWFYVPNRIIWEHWQEFLGENKQSAWVPSVDYEIPQLVSPSVSGWERGTIADYLGIPVGIPNLSVNALPFRAYAKICDEWFRSENVQDPLNIPNGDAQVTGSNGLSYVTDVAKGGMPFIANKYFDLFTSCLPEPLKGPDVTIGINADVPVYAASGKKVTDYGLNENVSPILFSGVNNAKHSFTDINPNLIPVGDGAALRVGNSGGTGYMSVVDEVGAPKLAQEISPVNLFADTSQVNMITINQLRQAFQVQRFYEANARGGTRYRELLKSHFGVNLEDSRAMVPEYLGGSRVPINISQVTQMAPTDSGSSPLGDVGGMSLTNDTHFDFEKSFSEHGILMCVGVCRYKHSYSQGLNKYWQKKDKFDFFFPTFANLGETAVKKNELMCTPDNKNSDEVFGYNESWYEYRYLPDFNTGMMRPSATGYTLDSWHFGDFYDEVPSLSADWLKEDGSNIDRCLVYEAFNPNVELQYNQLFADMLVSSVTTRVVPVYSVPGLLDHN